MKKKFTFYFFLILICVFFVLLDAIKLGIQLENKLLLQNTLDFSWSNDIIERFLHGYIAGRDFIFTYGPLYQVIASLLSIIFNIPSYVSALLAPLLLTFFNCVLVIFIVRAITRDKKDIFMLSLVLLSATSVFTLIDQNNVTRVLLPFAYIVLYIKLASITKSSYYTMIPVLLIPAVMGLYTYDLFILGIIITIAAICYDLYTAFKNKTHKKKIKYFVNIALIQLVLILVFELLVSVLLSGGFQYLQYSLDTIRSYQYIMNIPFSLSWSLLFLLFPLLLFVLVLFTLKKNAFPFHKKTFFLLTILSLLELKAAVIRADEAHIISGAYPSMLMLIVICYFSINETLRRYLCFLVLLLCISVPLSIHPINKSMSNVFNLFSSDKKFFDIYRMPKDYYLTEKDFTFFNFFIPQNKNQIMVLPYDNYVLNIYNTTYNTLPLQFYDYSNSLVERDAVKKLAASPPKYIILGIDKKGVIDLDNIPNLSRNPLLTKWMLSHYSLSRSGDKYFILQYDPRRTVQSKNTTCNIYEVNTATVIKDTILERFLKPATYYLNTDTGARLPNMADTEAILLLEGFSNPARLEELFKRKVDFTKYTMGKKKLTIVKKIAPGMEKIYTDNFSVKCY